MLFIGLLPTLIVSVVAYLTISSAITQKTAQQLISAATEQQQKVAGIIQTNEEKTIDLTNEYTVQSSLSRYMQTHSKEDANKISSALLNQKVLNPNIQSIYVVGLDGKAIATTVSSDQGKQFDVADYATGANRESILSIREDGYDSVDKLYVTTNIDINKEPAAYLRVIFYTDDIVAVLQDYTGLGNTGETLVASQDNQSNAISLFPLRFDTGAALVAKLNSLQLFSSFSNGYKDLNDYRDHDVMVAAIPLGYAGWVIATKIDSAEALASIAQMRSILLSISFVASALILGIALYFGNFFTKPILVITEAAKSIGRGNFLTRVNMKRKDEIGVLADNIDHMGVSLSQLVTSIETQRNRLELVLNSTTESILAIDRKGVIITVNIATTELTKLSVDNLVGKNIKDIFAWMRNGKVLQVDYGQAETKVYEDLQYVNHVGSTHYIKLIVARVKMQQSGEAPQIIVTIHDETKSRELETMKIDFVSMAAHELRTPLAAIRGYLELIMFKASQSNVADETEKYLKQALSSTSELSGLINNLLDVTRIERGNLTFTPEKVDLALSVKQSVQDARFSAEDKQIVLSYEGPSEGCFVVADQIAMREVFNNLVSNAIKYTNNKGTIAVVLTQLKQEYEVRVKDTGIGIPKSAQSNIFTKFFRAQAGLNSGNTGTGLGLYISKSIIERHGGTIDFESEEGVGSTFTVILPVFNEKQFEASRAGNHAQLTTIRRRKHGWLTKNIAR